MAASSRAGVSPAGCSLRGGLSPPWLLMPTRFSSASASCVLRTRCCPLDSALLGGSAAGRFLRAQAFGASYRWPLVDCGMPRTLGSSRLPYLRALERRAACGCPVFKSSEVLSLTCARGLAASQAMCSTRAPSDFCFLPSWEVELLAAPEWPGALACLLPGAGLPPPWCGLDVDGYGCG